MSLKSNISSHVSLSSLAVLIASGFKRISSAAKSDPDIESDKPSPVLKGKKSLLISLIVLALVMVGFKYFVPGFTKSGQGITKQPPQLTRLQPTNPVNPVTVKFGFLPEGIYDLDPAKGSFKGDFYIWLKYDKTIPGEYLNMSDPKKAVPDIERLEAKQGESLDLERQDYTPEDKPEHRVWYHIRGKFYHDFDMHQYPFDKQILEVRLENPIYPADQLRYVIDTASSNSSRSADGSSAELDPGLLSFSGWQTERVQHVVRVNHYPTDWGLPDEPDLREYSQSSLIITLKRRSGQHLAEIMFPLVAAALLATLVFFHSNKDLAPAIWICVAMFISVVGHHRGLLISMPDVRYFVTSDFFFLLTYLYIVMCLTIALISDYYSRKGQEQIAKMVCCRSRVILPISYLLLMSVVALPAFKS